MPPPTYLLGTREVRKVLVDVAVPVWSGLLYCVATGILDVITTHDCDDLKKAWRRRASIGYRNMALCALFIVAKVNTLSWTLLLQRKKGRRQRRLLGMRYCFSYADGGKVGLLDQASAKDEAGMQT